MSCYRSYVGRGARMGMGRLFFEFFEGGGGRLVAGSRASGDRSLNRAASRGLVFPTGSAALRFDPRRRSSSRW
jgi:hypothetical protein